MTGSTGDRPEENQEGPVIRDKRRFDPMTGELREPAQPASGATPAAGAAPDARPPAATAQREGSESAARVDPAAAALEEAELTIVRAELAERTADLQRLQAEYTNYRRRVERDRGATQEMAVANVLTNLLPVLDDIGRARDHGELEGGFKSVGEALEAVVEKLGLERFGTAGDPFDPTLHEALTHTHSADVSESTCVQVFQPGYRIGDRVMRPARVAVADPEE